MKNVLKMGLISSLVVMIVIALLNNIAINIEYYIPIGMLLIASLIVLLKPFINDEYVSSKQLLLGPVLPKPFFINGEFHWGLSIVSDGGIFQKVGIVKGNDQSKVFYAKTFEEAIKKSKKWKFKIFH